MAKKIREEDEVKFSDYKELSYYDGGEPEVTLYVGDQFVGYIKVWRDSEMNGREYICLNYEVVYLDMISRILA